MIKVIVNLNVCIKRVALVSLSLPLGLYGVFLAQPKVTSHITSGLNTLRFTPPDAHCVRAV